MAATITQDQWLAVRTSVHQTTDRLADLVASGRRREARATKRWSVAQTAAHVATVAMLHSHLIRLGGPVETQVDGLDERLAVATVDDVSALNEVMLAHYPQREPGALARWLREEVDRLLRMTEGMDPAATVAWLGSSTIPVAGVIAHMLNELSIHGRDIARATGDPWSIPPRDAAAFFEMFVVGAVSGDYGRLLDTKQPPRSGQVVAEFRSAHTTPVTFLLNTGRLSITEEPRPVDVRVRFRPAMLNLMMFGRVSKPRAVLTGGVVLTGRRPWLLPVFLRTVRMPS